MLFRLFQVFLAYVFLSGKLADPDPLSPPLSGKFHYFFFIFETFPKLNNRVPVADLFGQVL